mgnify:CR=1 FL=1
MTFIIRGVSQVMALSLPESGTGRDAGAPPADRCRQPVRGAHTHAGNGFPGTDRQQMREGTASRAPERTGAGR